MEQNDMARLVESCMGMVRYVAGVYGGGEDLIQDGIEGLLKAARNFDPEKGAFKPYARLYVMKACSKGRERCFEEIVAEPGESDLGFEAWEIRDAVGRLPCREQRFVRAYYGIGCPQLTTSELAAEEGVSEMCVRQVLCRARKKLREMLE